MRDLLVVGAGPVGLALAAEATRLGASVGIIDGGAGPGLSGRAVGVHPATLEALAPSGAGDALAAQSRHVLRGEARSDRGTLGTVRFDRLRAPFPFVATLPQERTEAVLTETIARFGGPAVTWGETVESVRDTGDAAVARVRDASGARREERARFIAVATGARGADVTGLRAGLRRREYPDRYLMADVPDRGGDGDTAVIHLHSDGVLESFPLPDGRRRYVAWVPTVDAALGEALRPVVEARVGLAAASAVETATAFGVRRTLVRRMHRGRIAILGDAAHEVSPIGGQGMNLGILDAVALARVLSASASGDGALARWDRRRRRAAALSARVAAINTRLGRPASGTADRARGLLLETVLRTPAEGLLARTYAMRFDPDAGSGRGRPPVSGPRAP